MVLGGCYRIGRFRAEQHVIVNEVKMCRCVCADVCKQHKIACKITSAKRGGGGGEGGYFTQEIGVHGGGHTQLPLLTLLVLVDLILRSNLEPNGAPAERLCLVPSRFIVPGVEFMKWNG